MTTLPPKISATISNTITSNRSANLSLSELLEKRVSRRSFLMGATSLSATWLTNFFPAAKSQASSVVLPPAKKKITALNFESVPFSVTDQVIVPEGYNAQLLYAWGDPVGVPGNNPPFKNDASNSAEEQNAQAGMHHDGMHFFPLPYGSKNSHRGLLAINHEYLDPMLLTPDGNSLMTDEKYKKALASVGVSIIEVNQLNEKGAWHVVRPSPYARRITAETPIKISGPATGHPLMQTELDPSGYEVLGTLQNCSNGWTPWGTYLTCEENFDTFFCDFSQPADYDFNKTRYGVSNEEKHYKWNEIDFRWDRQVHRNEINRFGWVVEIDPYDPHATPIKRTALGRIKHEGATVSIAQDKRIVIYMGDDQNFEYIYKFISKQPWNPHDRHANRHLLDHGTLYVATFDKNGSGGWRELTYGKNGLDNQRGFADQGEVLIKTRLAADLVGATKMDRPEWITVNPDNPGELFCTLTNNKDRGGLGKPDVDKANPRKNNIFGHIIRWVEDNNDPASLRFTWNIMGMAGRNDTALSEHRPAYLTGDNFGSPDGLHYAETGILWIQTDVSSSLLNQKEYAGMGNNMMLACIPETGQVKRFLTGPNGCEITGISFTPDHQTLFVNIQHPGEGSSNTPSYKVSNWPGSYEGARPRSATIAIRRKNGGIIGA
ncbi:MAG: PhoX family phosphatase [Pseudomonadota bacterium]